MEADLVTRLAAANTGAASVSWAERPKAGVLPAITVQRIVPGRDYSHQGAIALQTPRIQINVWGRSPAEVEAIEAAVIAELEQAKTVGATHFWFATLNLSPDLPAETLDGGTHVFRRAPDFTIPFG